MKQQSSGDVSTVPTYLHRGREVTVTELRWIVIDIKQLDSDIDSTCQSRHSCIGRNYLQTIHCHLKQMPLFNSEMNSAGNWN